jgi:hypothetical protein
MSVRPDGGGVPQKKPTTPPSQPRTQKMGGGSVTRVTGGRTGNTTRTQRAPNPGQQKRK